MSGSAAGKRRSAIAARVRLRAEWQALKASDATSDALRGVVALVEVGVGSKALALRSALAALGATVVPNWVPLVTHVVWSAEGCRKIRARARALACQLVSPLWVEACAASGRRMLEQAFPSAPRPSDLPSPKTLKMMLKIADKENIPLDVFTDTQTQDKPTQSSQPKPRLRISSETDPDKSMDTSKDSPVPKTVTVRKRTQTTAVEPSINYKKKSRRKLFTVKEPDLDKTSSCEEESPTPKAGCSIKLTQRHKRDLARAERLARKLANADVQKIPHLCTQSVNVQPRIVLSGLTNAERRQIFDKIKQLNGKIQSHVTKTTTHVILGSCNDGKDVHRAENNEITGIETLNDTPKGSKSNAKVRTLNALEGAARGCRILVPQWVFDSVKVGNWLHPLGYEVQHLRKLSQRARVERIALGHKRHDYAYDIFCGLNVKVTDKAEQKDSAVKLLKLCGANVVCENVDVTVGVENGQVISKWVFDSIASARARTIRRYIVNKNAVIEDAEGINTQLFLESR